MLFTSAGGAFNKRSNLLPVDGLPSPLLEPRPDLRVSGDVFKCFLLPARDSLPAGERCPRRRPARTTLPLRGWLGRRGSIALEVAASDGSLSSLSSNCDMSILLAPLGATE